MEKEEVVEDSSLVSFFFSFAFDFLFLLTSLSFYASNNNWSLGI